MSTIAVAPDNELSERCAAAVREAGATVIDVAAAEALVWTAPSDVHGLRSSLATAPARWVQLPSAGIERFREADVLDDRRVWTCAKGDVNGPPTAEMALALILAMGRQLPWHARRSGWSAGTDRRRRQLRGSTAVVVGTGGVGRALARSLVALGAQVIAVNRSGTPLDVAERTVPVSELVEVVGLADWLAIAAPHTPETVRLVDERVLASMRPDAVLVNVARGALVDTDAVVDALAARRIGGVALDVTDPEPLPDDHPLWGFDDVLITSHTANSFEWTDGYVQLVARNAKRFVSGEPLEGVIDVGLGY